MAFPKISESNFEIHSKVSFEWRVHSPIACWLWSETRTINHWSYDMQMRHCRCEASPRWKLSVEKSILENRTAFNSMWKTTKWQLTLTSCETSKRKTSGKISASIRLESISKTINKRASISLRLIDTDFGQSPHIDNAQRVIIKRFSINPQKPMLCHPAPIELRPVRLVAGLFRWFSVCVCVVACLTVSVGEAK